MRTWITIASFLCILALAIYLTSYFARLPESSCATSQVASSASNDHAYTAALLKKECDLGSFGETTLYSVRIDKSESPSSRGWFFTLEMEQDPYPAANLEPAIKWDFHKLEIQIPADTMSGSIEFRPSHDDLSVLRSYVPAHPK